MSGTTTIALAVSFWLLLANAVAAQDPLAGVNLPPNELGSYGNNSLFLRWRQRYHFLAPAGHMNDPCGPMYDNLTDTYHLFYQGFPNHVNGGNGSWGHAVSQDLITWNDIKGWQNDEWLALQPGPYPQYDWLGAWSGSAQPVSLEGKSDGNLTIMYTCVDRFPVGWREDEEVGSEEQCIATSSDGGLTWQKYEGNPVLNAPPEGWNFTGWRDPYFHAMPDIDTLLGYEEPHYYMVLGSGIHGAGPRIPLYTAKASDLTNWTYLGALFDVPGNFSWGGDAFRTGSLGYNFELAGFNSLIEKKEDGGDGETLHYFVNVGTEGGNNSYHPNNHWTLFVIGSVSQRANGSVEMEIELSAPLDWGNLYAATTFLDTKDDRRVLWGWSDEDLNGYATVQQGFQGSLGLPRELFILKTSQVLAPSGGLLKGPGRYIPKQDGTFTVMTLGSRPLPDVVEAIHLDSGTDFGSLNVSHTNVLEGVKSDHFHLRASLQGGASDGTAGFIFRASPEMEEFTRIVYDFANQTLTLDRTSSSLAPNFTKTNYQAFFEPYTILSDADTPSTESLDFDIFVDGSLIEIFINDRFALTSRAYPTRADALNLALFSEGGSACFENVHVWTDMLNVWPDRPLNSSSPLHYDPYYETHITYENIFGMEPGTKLYDGF